MHRIAIITGSTLNDELHHKSLYFLSLLALFFVLTLRGCFDNSVMVNGKELDGPTIGYHASMAAFHIIAIFGIIIGILISMRVLKRDKTDGTMAVLLSRPVRRIEYLTGKIAGVWIIAYGMTFMLHLAVYLIMLIKSGGRIVFFMPASFIVSLNILFIIVMVMLLSQYLPDIAAGLLAAGVVLIGYISDALLMIMGNGAVLGIFGQMNQNGGNAVALWRILWPKMAALQFYAVSLIKDTPLSMHGVHPALNVSAFVAVAFVMLWWSFFREEI